MAGLGFALSAAAVAGIAAPVQAVQCNSTTRRLDQGVQLGCVGGFLSAHRADGGTNKRVVVQLFKGRGLAKSVGLDTSGNSIGPNCNISDNSPVGDQLSSPAGACDNTAHPLAIVFAQLFNTPTG
jgi:hypothetical protein